MNTQNYLIFLRNVYNAFRENGSVSNIETYAKNVGVNPNVAIIMRKLKIVTKIPNTHSYVWSVREPDYAMVKRVMEVLSDYNRGVREFNVRTSPINAPVFKETTNKNVVRSNLSQVISELMAVCAANKISTSVLESEEGVKKVIAIKNLVKELK